MKYLSLLFFIFTIGCGRTPYVDPELLSYFKKFEKEIGYSTSNIIGIFTNLDAPTIGRCYFNDFSFEVIEIDRVSWIGMDYDSREQLMYHELGHCAMFLEHEDTIVNYQGIEIPGSIMNSYFFGDLSIYRQNKQKYKNALMNKTVVNLNVN